MRNEIIKNYMRYLKLGRNFSKIRWMPITMT